MKKVALLMALAHPRNRIVMPKPDAMPNVKQEVEPGARIDELLLAGDVAGAREEFETLCIEGLESEPIEMTPERWSDLQAELKRKAKLAS